MTPPSFKIESWNTATLWRILVLCQALGTVGCFSIQILIVSRFCSYSSGRYSIPGNILAGILSFGLLR
jgi:hypothetical protein